jgi:hypothetical protein
MRGRGPKSDDKPWTYGLDFIKQPPPAYPDFACVGALMQPPLTARFELEMLDRIGDISALAVNSGPVESFRADSGSLRNGGLIAPVRHERSGEGRPSGLM